MKQVDYTLAITRKFPEAVAVAVTWDEVHQRPNMMTLGWHMCTSFKPPMLAISIGLTRHTHSTLTACGEFVLAFPHAGQEQALLFCGTRSGSQIDKSKESGFTCVPSKLVRPPLIDDACANFECRVAGSIRAGDHTIFIGEVLASHVARHDHRRVYSMADGSFAPLGGTAAKG
jgi:flavin reductase (DIM6/NTAB) family NADH-FMN oxidoreductase RutF